MIMNEQFKRIIAEVFGLNESDVNEQLTKEDVGSWDSLKQMDLVVTLEREYSISLEIADIVKMVSVADIAEVLTDKGVSLED